MTARTVFLVCVVLLAAAAPPAPAALIHHELQVDLFPQEQRLTVQDRMTLPADRPDTLIFHLHAGLAPSSPHAEVNRESLAQDGPAVRYRVHLPPGQNQLVLTYGGRLHYALNESETEYARQMRRTQGQISPEGVYLFGGSLWYPQLADELLTFSLRIKMPEGWRAVSQGRRTQAPDAEIWTIDAPQEQIFLIAGVFTEYTGPAGQQQAMVFLRQPDPELAERYLVATARYIQMYEKLIGPYPYDKFALVENYWESGFGMPSFTLLGPKVIRFPFILQSSYPHEILHNWWGNSVYPRYAAGNWAEGLTAYLADHLLQEQRGQGAAYRQTVLQKYTDYVSAEKDFALVEFTGRHSSASEAVGYGKSMMFFHMLRRQLGDRTFIASLQAFYRRFRFQTATFTDLQQTFEEAAGKGLEATFAQWVRRSGAPQLSVESGLRESAGRYVIKTTFRQNQAGLPYALDVPVALTLAGKTAARVEIVALREREQEVAFTSDSLPLRLDVDPRYDLFRKLARTEIPPALSQVFGADKVLVVLPSNAAPDHLAAYSTFARSLAHAGPQTVETVLDRELDQLPADRNIVLLGWDNRFRQAVSTETAAYGAGVSSEQALLDGQAIGRKAHSVVLALRHPDDAKLVLAWIAADPPAALPGLARKLPHYHRYSYLAFEGDDPQNILQGRWTVRDSPMTVFFTDARPATGRLPAEDSLIR